MVKSLVDVCLSAIQVSLDHLPTVGNYLPTVYKELLIERLANHDLLSVEYLPCIASNLFSPSLRHLNLYKCDQVTDTVLELIATSGCKLEKISISSCINVTDAGVLQLTKDQDELVQLRLSKLRGITSKGLENVRSDKLEVLNLKGCALVTFEGVSRLVTRNPFIKKLIVPGINERMSPEKSSTSKSRGDYFGKDEDIVKIIQCLGPKLEEYISQMNQLSDSCIEAFANHCPNLKRLNVHGSSRISGEALIKLSIGCTQLESLDLSYCRNICEEPGCSALWTLPTSLTELSLCGVLLSNERVLVECFQRLRCLKSARLCGVTALNDKTLTAILQHVGATLTSLDISGGIQRELSDDGLQAVVKYCPHLENLSLLLLQGMSGLPLIQVFKEETRALKFKKLFLSIKELDPEVLTHIPACHNLELLDLSGQVSVTDDFLAVVARNCPNLAELSLKGCREVTDSGVCCVVRSCQLKSVVLAGIHNLTDKSIFAIANSCYYLEAIYLNGCAQISPTAVRYLVDCCIPRLFVKHATPNARPNQLMARNLDTGEFCRADLIDFDRISS